MLRGHQLDTKPIDLHAVIDESLALVAHDMRARQIEATVNLSSHPCIINGDQVLLQQVLVNLVMNAMDAMTETPPARCRVTITTEVRAADVDVSVRDMERGCPRRSTARCSRHSSRRKRTASASDSRSRRRSSRRMVGPSTPATIPREARRSRSLCTTSKHPGFCQVHRVPRDIPPKSMLPKRPRVLIAEDHPGVAKAIWRMLSLECEVVGNVTDGSAVLEAAQRLQPDVIVVDLNLRHVHGLEVCRQITQVKPEAKIIIFSAMNEPDVTQRSFEVGASAFVSKGTGNLLSTIKRLCDDRG